MKKFMIAALVAIVGIAFTAPAFAVEHEFGGYFRVRAFTNQYFDGSDKTIDVDKADQSMFDSRTRLFYTAKINDNLKFVNAFEMDADWGDDGYGDVGSDGVKVEVKRSYIDFNLGALNAKLGTQGAVLSRGFIFDDDFSGAVLSFGSTAFVFAKAEETGGNMGDDRSFFSLMHTIATDSFTITPEVTYVDVENSSYAYFLALNADMNFGAASVWTTLIYEGGECDKGTFGTTRNKDISAYLVAVGGDFAATDALSFHGQAFYASGDDDSTDGDSEGFGALTDAVNANGDNIYMPGNSYYWAEIMGLGTFDDFGSAGSPADDISNIVALNLGTTFKASEKLSLSFDVWYAMLAEDDANNEDELGTEVDVQATYQLIDGLTLDVVAAYLFADDATYDGSNDEDPYEFGAQLVLSF
jgi:hypothetical protein